MFGTNPVIGAKYFENFKENELEITSIFASIQGEGILSGQRSVFIRLAQCNLQCRMCDTYFSRGDIFTYDELLKKIFVTVNSWNKKNGGTQTIWCTEPEDLHDFPNDDHLELLNSWNLVITGGEPLLQKNLFPFLMRLIEGGYSPYNLFKNIQIESNGIPAVQMTVEVNGNKYTGDKLDPDTILIVSPKCVEKNGVPQHHIKPHKTTLARANHLKFVISGDAENAYYNIPSWALEWKQETGRTIYVSPMNEYMKEPQAAIMAAKSNKDISIEERSEVLERISFWEEGLLDMAANRRNHEYAALLAMRHDCILSLQTHLLASLP